ncbi:hypothetical protein [Xylanimonas ulmi]|uniref:DUF5709 domain-containing protein n=1 Tax=Xylanimonas ulmi TaxID=228973 RepID=A0A4V2EY47_9MICO|nr:hypothetical protein [Xylanibacterium ulmi]RZS61730.1 hypothetical protein EV386_2041 [Xylanibacterium ulmi]
MSTQPGRDAWRDTGLAAPDLHDPDLREGDGALDPDDAPSRAGAASLLEEALAGPGPSLASPEEYQPDNPRPDLAGAADEADVVDQAVEVRGLDDEDAYVAEPTGPEAPEDDAD